MLIIILTVFVVSTNTVNSTSSTNSTSSASRTSGTSSTSSIKTLHETDPGSCHELLPLLRLVCIEGCQALLSSLGAQPLVYSSTCRNTPTQNTHTHKNKHRHTRTHTQTIMGLLILPSLARLRVALYTCLWLFLRVIVILYPGSHTDWPYLSFSRPAEHLPRTNLASHRQPC